MNTELNLDDDRTVSYTHLDVYKRQTQGPVKALVKQYPCDDKGRHFSDTHCIVSKDTRCV